MVEESVNFVVVKGDAELDVDLEELLGTHHNDVIGHRGAQSTVQLLKRSGYMWNNMLADVNAFIRACPSCQKRLKAEDKRSPPMQHRLKSEPYGCVAIDTVGPLPETEEGYKYILTCVDEFSKVLSLFPLKTLSAIECAQCLNQIIGRVGCIHSIMSDNGTQFVNEVIDSLCSFWNIKHRTSLPYRPQANGIVERTNQEVMKHLRAIVFDRRVLDTWPLYLPMVERIINSSFHSSIGTAPIRMLYGDLVTLDRGLLTAWQTPESLQAKLGQLPVSAYIRQLNEQLETVAELSRKHQEAELSRERVRESKKPKVPRVFDVGDYVLATYPGRSPSKLTPKWRGPSIVLERKGNTYVVNDLLTNSHRVRCFASGGVGSSCP